MNEVNLYCLAACQLYRDIGSRLSLMFAVCINMAHERNKSELKRNTDSNDHETQTKIAASFVAIDISNLGHGAFVDRKINWLYQQKPVQNNSTRNKCFHLWKVPLRPELISAQAGTETNLVFTCRTFGCVAHHTSSLLSPPHQSQCAAIRDCQGARRGVEPCF